MIEHPGLVSRSHSTDPDLSPHLSLSSLLHAIMRRDGGNETGVVV